jgi:dihydroflavonol-4-reductase
MLVAVTGASGLVGSSIVRKLIQSGISTRSILRSQSALGLLADIKESTEIIESDVLDMAGLGLALEGADAVIHAAGYVSFNSRNRDRIHEINVQGTTNVVNACLQLGTRKLIHISSVAALGRQRGSTTINEETRWVPGMPASDYATSKYMAEVEVFRGMEEGLNVSLINPSVVLSAADGIRSSSQLFNYVWKQRMFYANVAMNYVDARDVAEMVTRILNGDYNGERFIANAGREDLKTVFELIGKRLEKRPPFIDVPKGLVSLAATVEQWRAGLSGREPMVSKESVAFLKEKIVFENNKAKKVLGMEFQTLESTLDWCCDEFRTININK